MCRPCGAGTDQKQHHPEQALPILRTSRRRASRKRLRGAIYARFSTRFQHSIDDQIRSCREWAARNDVEVLSQHVFSDEATTGKTQNRPGLRELLTALEENEIDIVIVFSTNRLYRKMYRALGFVAEEIIDRQKRCVFVAQNIDTEKTEAWQQIISVYAMVDEVQIQHLGGQVRAAHEGLLLKKHVHGTLSFGYTGKVIDGSLTRLGKPRRKMAIDEQTAKWVVQAFQWFVGDQLNYHQIARKLHQENVPPPPRVRHWTWRAVRYLLANRRYVGDWSYGVRQAVWQNKAGYSRQFLRERPLMPHRIEELRIVDDATFLAAQERMAQSCGRGGRKRSGRENAPPHLLKGLLWCATHNHELSVCGGLGKLLDCPACKADPNGPALFSMVNRQLAQRLICEELARRIRDDVKLVAQIIASAQRQVEALQAPDPAQVAEAERNLKAINERITFVLDNPGESNTDKAENAERLRKLRGERAAIERRVAELRAAGEAQIAIPDERQVRRLLGELQEILVHAAEGKDHEEIARARRIVHELTDGRILMSQQGEARPRGGWLRGTFKLRVASTILRACGCAAAAPDNTQSVEVSIDFRRPAEAESLAEQVKALCDQGLLLKQIARQLGVGRNLAAAALAHWYTSRDLPVPDGRTRRSSLKVKHLVAPLYQRIADPVMELANQGLLLHEIAQRLNCDHNTITQAIRWWHESRGLEVPDGRTRRKSLQIKGRTRRVPDKGPASEQAS